MPVINGETIEKYLTYQREQERSRATIQKYQHDLYVLMEFLDGKELTKAALIGWKEMLVGQYAPASVNAMLAAVNGYVKYMGWMDGSDGETFENSEVFVSGRGKGTYQGGVCASGEGGTAERE